MVCSDILIQIIFAVLRPILQTVITISCNYICKDDGITSFDASDHILHNMDGTINSKAPL